MTVWVTFNTTFVIYSGWLMDLCILICNSLPVRVRWDLLSTFVLNPCWLFFSEDPDFVPEDYEYIVSAPKLIEWSRDRRRASLVCHYANRYPMVICGSLVLSLYSSCTCWIKLCMTLDSTWCNMYYTRDRLRLLIHDLASIFGDGAL